MKISKKEQKRVLEILKSIKINFIECPESGNENMPNRSLSKKLNWEIYPIYRVTYKKDGTFTRKRVNNR